MLEIEKRQDGISQFHFAFGKEDGVVSVTIKLVEIPTPYIYNRNKNQSSSTIEYAAHVHISNHCILATLHLRH